MRDILQTMSSDGASSSGFKPHLKIQDQLFHAATPPTRFTGVCSKDAAFEQTLEIKKVDLFFQRDSRGLQWSSHIFDAVNPSPRCLFQRSDSGLFTASWLQVWPL